MPIIKADNGLTNPEAGVIATRPTTAPVARPKTLGRLCTQLIIIQVKAAEAAAVFVTTTAEVANHPEVKADPPLKPNQPNHNRNAPNTVNGIFAGSIGALPYPLLFPITIATAKADIPAVI